jgi:hypothetical protein
MSDFEKTVEEAARLLDERAIVFEERTRARMRDAARALRSGLAPALERAREEERERIRMADVLASVHGIDPLPAPPPSTPAADELPRTEPDGRRTGDCDCPACDAADAGGRRCGTCAEHADCDCGGPCKSWRPRREEGSRD